MEEEVGGCRWGPGPEAGPPWQVTPVLGKHAFTRLSCVPDAALEPCGQIRKQACFLGALQWSEGDTRRQG